MSIGESDNASEQLEDRNDPRLRALIAADPLAAERETERLVIEVARPIVARVFARYRRTPGVLRPEDAEDLRSIVELRLLERLRAVPHSEDGAIRSLASFVAALTYNAVNDYLRRRFPERARLKNRLRHALMNDARVAIWNAEQGPACGMAEWSGREDLVEDADAVRPELSRRLHDRDKPAEAMGEIFRQVGRPLLFDTLVEVVARLWNVADSDAPAVVAEELVSAGPSAATVVENRDFARALWREIRELRPMQRQALLLNLRHGGEGNVVALLILSGIAQLEEIAAALEMTPDELRALWSSLPLEDLAIAERMGITRQQVINLRKAARERLARRLGR
ncbi:MAG: hypothetical protein JOZ54_23355 [Acidobacteria bacterium]|nr:hypothetical protein [Acidobacteriota bacterium]